ncbi:MAG: peptidase M22 [Clostridia bacterium]|nr:peptidase M22 [Clostridia bacterium]
MAKGAFIGIDTSNYTTSIAIIDGDGTLVANLKRPLAVKQGERGLRQSDALFNHTVNIPNLMREAGKYLSEYTPLAVGVSTRPRNQEGSYMPCFLAGVSAAESASALMGVPLYTFSHQCGHIMAALYSAGKFDLLEREFAALHLSGGTTELVRVKYQSGQFVADICGGTRDLAAGQIIDRVGVYLGLPFPAGAHLERLALENTRPLPKTKLATSSTYVNFSGVENMAIRLYKETEDRAYTAHFVLDYIGRAISKILDEYTVQYGEAPFLFAGGVMCNSIIKSMVSRGREAYFAEPSMSADNAVGTAALAMQKYKMENT